MRNIIRRPGWYLPERFVTPENVYRHRRDFLKQLGLAGAGLLSIPLAGCSKENKPEIAATASASTPPKVGDTPSKKLYPAARNPDFNPKTALTDEKEAGSYNNFYEFSLSKAVTRYTEKFVTSPWSIQISGLVEKPMQLDWQEIIDSAPLEERVYRMRCVEAWAMVVPWTGFPLSKLIEKAAPKSSAKFVRFETFNRPEQCPGMRSAPGYPWPYFEGLRLDEAMNPLTLVVTGIYGKPLPKQHGAPVRIVVPWKYGYKSIKSIVKMEFISAQPTTFWETLQPEEYPFESNVNPNVPHPRWSQATERMIDTGDRVKTQLYNGYGSYVSNLYGRV